MNFRIGFVVCVCLGFMLHGGLKPALACTVDPNSTLCDNGESSENSNEINDDTPSEDQSPPPTYEPEEPSAPPTIPAPQATPIPDSNACAPGQLRCGNDGKCYDIDNPNSCCAMGGACQRGKTCLTYQGQSVCCAFGQDVFTGQCKPLNGADVRHTLEKLRNEFRDPVQYTFCNKTSGLVYAAFGYKENGLDNDFRYRGWLALKSGECKTKIFQAGTIYYRATSKSGQWGEGENVCVTDDPFDFRGNDFPPGCKFQSFGVQVIASPKSSMSIVD